MALLTANRLVRPASQTFRFPRHERTTAWPCAEGEEQLRNALGRGQAAVLLFVAQAVLAVVLSSMISSAGTMSSAYALKALRHADMRGRIIKIRSNGIDILAVRTKKKDFQRTAAWPRAEGEDELRNALVRGQSSVLLFMALK